MLQDGDRKCHRYDVQDDACVIEWRVARGYPHSLRAAAAHHPDLHRAYYHARACRPFQAFETASGHCRSCGKSIFPSDQGKLVYFIRILVMGLDPGTPLMYFAAW